MSNIHANNFGVESEDQIHNLISPPFQLPSSPILFPLQTETGWSSFDFSSLVDTLLIELLQPLNIPHSYVEFVIKSIEQHVSAILDNL